MGIGIGMLVANKLWSRISHLTGVISRVFFSASQLISLGIGKILFSWWLISFFELPKSLATSITQGLLRVCKKSATFFKFSKLCRLGLARRPHQMLIANLDQTVRIVLRSQKSNFVTVKKSFYHFYWFIDDSLIFPSPPIL